MSYTTGTANGFADVDGAFRAALLAAGWQGIGDGQGELSLAATNNYLKLSAKAGGVSSPAGVCMVDMTGVDPIIWPARYEIHVLDNPKEAYCLLNYNVDRYQYLAMGVSPAAGISGTGVWISGTAQEGLDAHINIAGTFYNRDTGLPSYNGAGVFVPALLGSQLPLVRPSQYWHDGLDDGLGGGGWCPRTAVQFNYSEAQAGDGYSMGTAYCGSLRMRSPSAANLATPLLPVYGVRNRRDKGASIGVALAHARYCRIDHMTPGEIITWGGDRWRVYPEYRKNADERNGVDIPQNRKSPIPHSGTYGWAVRYTGP